jgi:hypothetical protein
MNFWEIVLGQVLALVTFFAFPAIQYVWLKTSVRKEGQPALWYLPDYGFRLVIRNLPRKKTLTDINYKTYLRQIVRATSGASVATYDDKMLVEVDDFFLFPGIDQVLISFKLEKKGKSKKLYFVHTSKLADEKEQIPLDSITYLISDYTANIENLFNFDVKVAKQVRISSERLKEIWEEIQVNNFEQSFSVSEVRNIE